MKTWEDKLVELERAPEVVDVLDTVLYSAFLKRNGLWLEFGVYEGASLRRIAPHRGTAKVFGFDSFQGLPEDWRPGHPKGEFALAATQARPMVEGAELMAGLFEETLPRFCRYWEVDTEEGRDTARARVTFVHVDCDLYPSTECILRHLRSFLVPGAVIVFDELLDYPGHEEHELRALKEAWQRGLHFEALCRSGEKAAIRILR